MKRGNQTKHPILMKSLISCCHIQKFALVIRRICMLIYRVKSNKENSTFHCSASDYVEDRYYKWKHKITTNNSIPHHKKPGFPCSHTSNVLATLLLKTFQANHMISDTSKSLLKFNISKINFELNKFIFRYFYLN